MKRIINVLSIMIFVFLLTMHGLAASDFDRHISNPDWVYYNGEVAVKNPLNDCDLNTTFHLKDFIGEPITLTYEYEEFIHYSGGVKVYVSEINPSLRFGIEYINTDGDIWTYNYDILGDQLHYGWNAIDFSAVSIENSDIKTVRFTFYASDQEDTGLSEVEVWDKSYSSPIEEYTYEQEIVIPSGSTNIFSWDFEITQNLDRLKQAFLVYDVYDLEYKEGQRKVNDQVMWLNSVNLEESQNSWVYVCEEINPNLLVRGDNHVGFFNESIGLNGFKIKNLKLKLVFDKGQIDIKRTDQCEHSSLLYTVNNTIDGELGTFWESKSEFSRTATIQFDFYESYDLELAQIYLSSGNYDQLVLYGLDPNYGDYDQRIAYPNAKREKDQLSDGWNSFKPYMQNYYRGAKGIEIDITNGNIASTQNLIGRIHEVKFWGSLVKPLQAKPEIVITYPYDGDSVGNETVVKGFIKGDAEELTINGQIVPINNGSFEYLMDLTNISADSLYTITVEATNAEGITSTKEVKVGKNPAPKIEIISPTEEIRTNNNQITISGTVDEFTKQLYINEFQVGITGNSFEKVMSLTTGGNLFVIKAIGHDGQVTTKEVKVIYDADAPRFFNDENNFYYAKLVSTNEYTIKAYIWDYSPICVTFNDQLVESTGYIEEFDDGYRQFEVYEKVFPLDQGDNYIRIHVEDACGNIADGKWLIKSDTTPPNPFTVIAEPDGWTNNNRPIIKFEATDDVTMIYDYEIQIDGKIETLTSNNEYQLPELTDGIHQITVVARNYVYLRQSASTEVYIDTEKPLIPTDFEAISAENHVILKWKNSTETDLVKYRLYRSPVFSEGGNFIDILAESEYIDNDVIVGNEYSYALQAVDHANNISYGTQMQTVTPGVTMNTIDIELGGQVKFDEVNITIPAGAIPEEYGAGNKVKVLVTPVNDPVPSETGNTVIGTTYAFNLLDENNQPRQNVEFQKPVTLEFGYNDNDIPVEFSPADLAVYYYDISCETWVKIGNPEVDYLNQTIKIETTHFTNYQIQLEENYSPDKERYKDMGLSPYQNYFKNNEEMVSPASGNLVLNTIDIFLPGRNGLDLAIGRIYDTQRKVYKPSRVYDAFGPGWELNIPRIEKNNHGQYLYFEDGSANELKWRIDKDGHGTVVYHEGQHFSGEKFQQKVKDERFLNFKTGEIWETIETIITRKDGRVYTFDAEGKIQSIEDRTRENKIEFFYDGKKLLKIVDMIGREVNFVYNDDNMIKQITSGDISYSYEYNENRHLYRVIDLKERITTYHYDQISVRYGSRIHSSYTVTCDDKTIKRGSKTTGSITERNVWILKEVIYPNKNKTEYSFTIKDLSREVDKSSTKTERHVVSDDNGNKKTVTIKTTVTVRGEIADKAKVLVTAQNKYLDQNSADIYSQISYNYDDGTIIIGPEGNKSKLKFSYDNLLVEKQQFIGDKVATKQVFVYNLFLKEVEEEKLYRSGELVLHKKYQYDYWGNRIYEYNLDVQNNPDHAIEKYFYYLNTNSSFQSFPEEFTQPNDDSFSQVAVNKNIHNLLAHSFILNQNPLEKNTMPIQSHYVYSAEGNLEVEANWNDTQEKWIKTKYLHDQYGNIEQIIDPLGNVTELEYSTEYSSSYLTKVIQKGLNGDPIKDATGNPIPGNFIIKQMGYDKSTGLKSWEIDAEGNLTEYDYDHLRRLTKVIYPDDDDRFSGMLGSLHQSSFTGREKNPVKIQYYDDTLNQTTVVNATEDMLLTDSAITDDLLIEPIFNKSRYHYDGLNRMVQIDTFNRNEAGVIEVYSMNFIYDKSGRRTAVKDAEGHITFTEYDELDRVTRIIYPDGTKLFDSSDNGLYTTIDYHPTINQRTITDAESNQTRETSDWFGNVTKVEKKLDGNWIGTSIQYDQVGNQVKVIDAEGRVMQYKYDSLGRLVEEILPEDQYVKPIPETNWSTDTWVSSDFLTVTYQPSIFYGYDDAGRKTKEIRPNSYWLYGKSESNLQVYKYKYDAVGNMIQETNPSDQSTYYYYDKNGTVVKVKDPVGNITQKMYSARGWVIAESVVNGLLSNEDDVSGEIGANDLVSYYTYDIIGNRTSVTSPQGVIYQTTEDSNTVSLFADPVYEHNENPYYKIDPEYKQVIKYDHLSRMIEEKRRITEEGSAVDIITKYKYDKVGNKVEIINPENQKVVYKYTPQYWLENEKSYDDSGKEYLTSYTYDKVGNQKTITDPAGKMIEYIYDDLYRMKEVKENGTKKESIIYDKVGNKKEVINGKGYVTTYDYNKLNQLTKIMDAESGITDYSYDPVGNLMKKVLPNNVTTNYIYDQLGQLIREIRPEGGVIKYTYDGVGNLKEKIDRKGQKTEYIYRRDYRPVQINYGTIESATYVYDREGRRLLASDQNSVIKSKYDPLGRIIQEDREIKGTTYVTGYKYDKVGNLRFIKYPDSSIWLEYKYNKLNHLVGIDGFADGTVADPAFTYKDNGFLAGIRYSNGTNTEITPDANFRVEEIKVTKATETLFDISYAYDGNDNVESRTSHMTGKVNSYTYDGLDRLKTADVGGAFYGEKTGSLGIALEDILGDGKLVEPVDYWVKLDYGANSVGVVFAEVTDVDKIELKSTSGVKNHRVVAEKMSIYYSNDNIVYHKLSKDLWSYTRDEFGNITISFDVSVPALVFKIHSKFDDRDMYFDHVDKSEFKGDLRQMVKVYCKSDSARLEYDYDPGGNRTAKRMVIGNVDEKIYVPYDGSNRLKRVYNSGTGETIFYYVYDANGNLVEKGNRYTENANGSVEFDKVNGEYWHYEYTEKDRLKAVYRNDEPSAVAEFIYDVDGNRIWSDTMREGTVSYVFNYAGKALYEDYESESKSFIYAHTRQIARVEGIVGSDAEVVYYHHDNLGSTRLMTDDTGVVVWEQDYVPFGEDLPKSVAGQVGFSVNAEYKFTGQREVAGIGLYYYGARHYDPEIGRFITEDTYQGEINSPMSQNVYIYVLQNPLKYIDPTGHNALEKTLNSFKEIAIGFWNSAEYRAEHMLDSPYDFANYWTVGLLDTTSSGLQERSEKKWESPYHFINYLTLGTCDTIKGAINPKEPFSVEHWLNSFETAGMVIGGMEALKLTGSTSTTLLGELDDSFTNQVVNKMDDSPVDEVVQGMSNPKTGTLSNVDARKWYLYQETKIKDLVDTSLSLEEQAKQAFNLRNQFRTKARELMADRTLAEELMRTNPNLTWDDVLIKYQNKGFSGDELWQEIIEASTRSRSSVNKNLGLE